MSVSELTGYLYQYGAAFIFIIVFLEYLNLPGFPAGVIMPLAGVWAASGSVSFFTAVLLSLLAGMCGSWMLYFLGRLGGGFLLDKYEKRFPKSGKIVEEKADFLREKGSMGIFISKLIPMVRTIISIPAGMIKMDFMKYTISSALGIFVWNGVLISTGYFFSAKIMEIIG